MIYAVIDTNVVVSALLSKNQESATVKVFKYVLEGDITPLFNEEIIAEYTEVLKREKFNFDPVLIDTIINFLTEIGTFADRATYPDKMPDEDDRVFYEITLSEKDSFLVTGNLKHYPQTPQVVSPAEMLAIIEATK